MSFFRGWLELAILRMRILVVRLTAPATAASSFWILFRQKMLGATCCDLLDMMPVADLEPQIGVLSMCRKKF